MENREQREGAVEQTEPLSSPRQTKLTFILPLFCLGFSKAQQLPPGVPLETVFLLVSIETLVPIIAKYETPIATRLTDLFDASWWHCMAVYSDSWKDIFTNELPSVRSPDPATYLTANRAACLAQVTASLSDLLFQKADGGNPAFLQAMAGIPFAPVLDDKIDPDVLNCGTDTGCLNHVASLHDYSPTIMGHVVSMQTYNYAVTDGFNMLGTDNGCVVHCRNYSDTTGFEPVNSVNNGGNQKVKGRWLPLMEDDGRGFFYEQKHVTPHIGTTAKFRFLPESDRTERVVRKPNYTRSRRQEAQQVLDIMAGLDDFKKMEIEAFDDKLYLAVQLITNFIVNVYTQAISTPEWSDPDFEQAPGITLPLERLVHFVLGYTSSELDAVIIAWKEKIRYDLIRPTSVIKLMGETSVTTWAPYQGTIEFPARDFEAYIRVMPHSEYISGTACIVETLKDYIGDYLHNMGLPNDMAVQFAPVEIGTSKVEPGSVPSTPIVLSYSNLSAMAIAGSQSRINGGMHFEDSVPAAQEVCSGIGSIAASGMLALIREGGVSY